MNLQIWYTRWLTEMNDEKVYGFFFCFCATYIIIKKAARLQQESADDLTTEGCRKYD